MLIPDFHKNKDPDKDYYKSAYENPDLFTGYSTRGPVIVVSIDIAVVEVVATTTRPTE